MRKVFRAIGVNRLHATNGCYQVPLTNALFRHAVLRFCYAGKMRFVSTLYQTETELGPGDLMFRPALYRDHAACLDPAGEIFMLVFESAGREDSDQCFALALPEVPCRVAVPDPDAVRATLLKIQAEVERKEQDWETMIQSLAAQLMVAFDRLANPAGPAARDGRETERAIVQLAKEFMGRSYERPIELQEVAKAVHVSPNHLLRLFRELESCTPMDYLRGLRMELAARRMHESRMPLKVMASEFGYGSPEAFCKAFRRRFGASPRAYRGALRKRADEQAT